MPWFIREPSDKGNPGEDIEGTESLIPGWIRKGDGSDSSEYNRNRETLEWAEHKKAIERAVQERDRRSRNRG